MKPKRNKLACFLRLIALLLITSAVLCACGKSAPGHDTQYPQAPAIETGEAAFRIAVASDLHINPATDSPMLEGQLYAWNIEITKALLWNVQREGADLLVVTGDITNGSRQEQHAALLELLSDARENGLNILIIDGNHDIGKTTPSEFAEFYADYGYGNAHSRDTASLSYSIRLPQTYLILVDTGGYTGNNLSGTVTAKTLLWLEEQLREAQESGLPAIVFGHYPLLTAQSGEFIGLEEMKKLLLDYRVPLYICGHMHGRNIMVQDTLTELVVEQTIAYPCSYALITQYSGGELQFEPRMADVESWALAANNTEPAMLEFDSYREMLFRERCEDVINGLREKQTISDKKAGRAFEFYYDFQYALSNGHLFGEIDNLKKHRGYSAFMELAKGSVYERWIPATLEFARHYSEGFMIIDNKIYRTAGN